MEPTLEDVDELVVDAVDEDVEGEAAADRAHHRNDTCNLILKGVKALETALDIHFYFFKNGEEHKEKCGSALRYVTERNG